MRKRPSPILHPSVTANRQLGYFFLTLVLWLAAFTWQASAASRPGSQLPLDAFLEQVRTGNTGVRGASEISRGAELRSQEGELLTTATVFANVQYTHDGKFPAVPLYTYSFQNTTAYTLGISKLTDFGLQAKLSYTLLSLSLENPNLGALAALAGGGGTTPGTFGKSYNTATTLELSQSLLSNGFGASTRAQKEVVEASALAASYANRFAARASLTEAEAAYWRLATAREAVQLTRANLERAQKNYDWASRRAQLQLADRSDALQSQAQLNARTLEAQRAQDDERVASRAFNTARGVDGDAVPESLMPLSTESVLSMRAPSRADRRDDVRAAEQQQRAARAGALTAYERAKPTLDVYGSLSLNGRDPLSIAGEPALGNAVAQSFSFVRPTAAIGVRLSAPLAFGNASDIRAGYTREQDAADLVYQRRVFEQEQSWRDLSDRLSQAKGRLKLAHELEKTQSSKLGHEQARLRSGRSTAFQVLSFETDYAVAELQRIQAQSEVLGILTQMKLFGETQ